MGHDGDAFLVWVSAGRAWKARNGHEGLTDRGEEEAEVGPDIMTRPKRHVLYPIQETPRIHLPEREELSVVQLIVGHKVLSNRRPDPIRAHHRIPCPARAVREPHLHIPIMWRVNTHDLFLEMYRPGREL